MLLIGSRAAQFHFPDFPHVRDWDFLAEPQEIADWLVFFREEVANLRFKKEQKVFAGLRNGDKFEFEVVLPGSSSDRFLQANRQFRHEDEKMSYYVARPETLWLLKKSHICSPIHWRKNIEDYHFFKAQNMEPREEEWLAFELRRGEVESRFKKRAVNLNVTNKEFFDKSAGKVPRFHEHDDLHRVTCYYDHPIYEGLKRDRQKAKIEQDLFEDLPYEDRLRAVREECFAIALERKVVPAIMAAEAFDADEAYLYALQRICTTLTSGWFREFAVENYPALCQPDRDYVGYFLDAVNDGLIRRLT